MEQFYLPDLKCTSEELFEFLNAIFQTILFNRAIGEVEPRDKKIKNYDIYYVRVKDQEISQKLESEINRFIQKLLNSESKQGEFKLQFYVSKLWSLVGKTWEEWILKVEVVKYQTNENNLFKIKKKTKSLMFEILKKIIDYINLTLSKEDYFPKDQDSDGAIPFKFKYESTIF
ncbi:hypothetical protein M0813_02700 [Anaeramoeba flamelloides]|uniref:Autophagy-related protein 101 n=1 Tax=Anaeramoeba flamelloides TaxID=1746091 RepID=A0ABQ8YE29_9EUKA|nr:hypothetical protein M0813_02700 [Anaeramoeba flamelloides]